MPFLGQEELGKIRAMRMKCDLNRAEKILLTARPMSPAVLDELRKIGSTRARQAKKRGDWQAVVAHLERYMWLAQQYRKECIQFVNASPPEHTASDKQLLKQARLKLK